ncbi:hypothetical protein CRM89_29515 [Nocardia sp. FDAARGOS_372]|nr:hypothetical protein CRM89_29515 [Nocardia sp. FDAARGOS_372]
MEVATASASTSIRWWCQAGHSPCRRSIAAKHSVSKFGTAPTMCAPRVQRSTVTAACCSGYRQWSTPSWSSAAHGSTVSSDSVSMSNAPPTSLRYIGWRSWKRPTRSPISSADDRSTSET